LTVRRVRYARRVKRFGSAVLLLVLAGCSKPVALHGTVIDPPRAAAPLDLTQQNGKPFSLEAVRGVPAAVFFGFTHCKDVCPATLELLQHARERAGLRREGAAILFVSVDPKRDNPAVMRTYLRRIRVGAIGLTGTPRELSTVERAYGVSVIPRAEDIVHGNYIYVIDRAGRLRELLHPDSPVADIASDFKKLSR
jgi:protein SCO1